MHIHRGGTMPESPSSSTKASTGVDHLHRLDLLALGVAGLTIFYYLALFSFHPDDSSWLAASAPSQRLENVAGQAGSYIASFFLYHLGLGAFLLPLPFCLAVIGRLIHGSSAPQRRWGRRLG